MQLVVFVCFPKLCQKSMLVFGNIFILEQNAQVMLAISCFFKFRRKATIPTIPTIFG